MTDEERREYCRKYYREHRDAILQKRKEYRAEHLEKERERLRKQQREHSEQYKEYHRKYWQKYYARNREKILAKNRRWVQAHPDYRLEYRAAHLEECLERERKYRETHREERREYDHKRYIKQKAIQNGTYFEWPEELLPEELAMPDGCVYPDCFHCPFDDCVTDSIGDYAGSTSKNTVKGMEL